MTLTATKENHALTNCMSQLSFIKDLFIRYRLAESNNDYDLMDQIREEVNEAPLSIEYRSGWVTHFEDDVKPEEFKLLLSWGGPACRIIGKIEDEFTLKDIEIQYQDWGTPWISLQLNSHLSDKSPQIIDDYEALEWFCNGFYFG